MNQNHDNDRKRFQAQPATAEQLNLKRVTLDVFAQTFLAFQRAHYTGMARKPRSKEQLKFCLRELKRINNQQEIGKGYVKTINE